MARRNLHNRLIHRSMIKDELRLIDESYTDYITRHGEIYKDYGDGFFLPKKTHISKSCGYTYCGITCKDGINRNRRVHVLVAKAYLPNPYNLPYVGHKHNNKECTELDELYWTDASENTKRAFDDGMIKNASGFEDSQSFWIDVYDLDGNLLETCGSVHIASRKYNVSMSTVLRHCRNEIKSYRIDVTFRFYGDDFLFSID